MVKRLLIMGPQGVGKGTQAAVLGEHFGIQPISTGDIFRYNIKNATELGEKVKAIIDRGELVSDELTGELVRDALSLKNSNQEGFILDGYPRNHNQVVDLDATLSELGITLDAVVTLQADRDVLLERMLKRAQIEGRADDTEEAIKKRLEIYELETAPLVNEYRSRGILVPVDGTPPIEDVTNAIITAIKEL
ncbi:MAG: adenylate kinase [Candidatus Ancillula sp.]|jgi:adenylate kinase|nr:adenylate kinase [Candidatus Ancillula sp.]